MKQRELKFRAWDNKNKKFPFVGFNLFGEVTMFDLLKQYTLQESIDSLEFSQFTGICDIDGNEVYEGDVIQKTKGKLDGKVPNRFRKVVGNIKRVEFKDGSFVLKRSNASDSYRLSSLIIRYYGFKVVGNVFENPELLEK